MAAEGGGGGTVAVLVLGDVGRSPRMMNHACSLAAAAGRPPVSLVGFFESDVSPRLAALMAAGRVVPWRLSSPLPPSSKPAHWLPYLLWAALKVLLQVAQLVRALLSLPGPLGAVLVQNPPAIPALAVARACCW